MELLLPVALTLFPNMLPSTFTDKFKEVSPSPPPHLQSEVLNAVRMGIGREET